MQFYTQSDKDKKSCEKSILILFKFPSKWNDHILRKLATKFNIYWGYINSSYQQVGSVEFASQVLKFSTQQKITSILLDIEFFSSFHLASIDLLKIGDIKVGVFLFDDSPLHLINRIFATRVDFIVTTCPISNLKYQELGMQSIWVPLESDSLYINQNQKKPIDILFFGKTTCADRTNYLSPVKNLKGVVTVIFDPAIDGFLDQTSFAHLLSSSKVIINLSKSDIFTNSAFSLRPSNFIYQLKSRVGEALFSGSICISEYAPQHTLLNINNQLMEFRTPDELMERLDSFDYSISSFQRRQNDFHNQCWPKFCDASNVSNLDQLFNEIQISKVNLFNHSKKYIDDRYFDTTSNVIKQYFSHNLSLCESELDLLRNCK